MGIRSGQTEAAVRRSRGRVSSGGRGRDKGKSLSQPWGAERRGEEGEEEPGLSPQEGPSQRGPLGRPQCIQGRLDMEWWGQEAGPGQEAVGGTEAGAGLF